jgi:starch synthase
MQSRLDNRHALQAYANLPQRDDIPLIAVVSRLTWQKGFDLLGHPLHLLMNGYSGDAQFIVLGTGDAHYETMFANMASYHQGKMAAILSYNAGLAPLLYAGSDIFLMPSLFEPCGLGQLIAMRYGSVPLVRATGGLADTVEDGVTGFTFANYNWESLWQAMQRAIYTYNVDKDIWGRIQKNGMLADYSWEKSALGYQQVYEWAVARVRGG